MNEYSFQKYLENSADTLITSSLELQRSLFRYLVVGSGASLGIAISFYRDGIDEIISSGGYNLFVISICSFAASLIFSTGLIAAASFYSAQASTQLRRMHNVVEASRDGNGNLTGNTVSGLDYDEFQALIKDTNKKMRLPKMLYYLIGVISAVSFISGIISAVLLMINL